MHTHDMEPTIPELVTLSILTRQNSLLNLLTVVQSAPAVMSTLPL